MDPQNLQQHIFDHNVETAEPVQRSQIPAQRLLREIPNPQAQELQGRVVIAKVAVVYPSENSQQNRFSSHHGHQQMNDSECFKEN